MRVNTSFDTVPLNRLVFMLGETTDQAIQAKIEKEAEKNGDIVQVNYTVYVHRQQCKIICTFLKWTVP